MKKKKKKQKKVSILAACEICDCPAVWTPSGTTCTNGHGGAPWYLACATKKMFKQLKQLKKATRPKQKFQE